MAAPATGFRPDRMDTLKRWLVVGACCAALVATSLYVKVVQERRHIVATMDELSHLATAFQQLTKDDDFPLIFPK